MKKPVVSVVIPVFNNARYIEKCIDSILAQKYKAIEIIIIDDGSTDGSGDICDRYRKSNKHIKVIHTNNSGVSEARNLGIMNSSGKYIFFVDSDDYLLDGFTDYMVGLMAVEDGINFGVSKKCFYVSDDSHVNTPHIDSEYTILNADESIAMLLSNNITVGCWNKIYNRQFLIDNKLFFDKNLIYGEGLDFIVRTAKKAGRMVMGNSAYYCYRRDNQNSATKSYSDKKVEDGEKSLIKIRETVIDDNLALSLKQWNIHYCNFCINAARDSLANGRPNANKWLKKARKMSRKLMTKSSIPLKYRAKMFIVCIYPKLLCLRATRNHHGV